MCLSQLEILAKRNLRNFSYSTWHRACLATSFWVVYPPKRKIWSSVAFVQRWRFVLKSCSLFTVQYQLSQPLLQSSRTARSLQQNEHYLALLFSLGKQHDRDTHYFPSLHRYISLHKSGHSGPNPRGLACNVNRKCLTAWSISLGCSPPPLYHHQRLDGDWVQPEVREVPGVVPVAIFSPKVQKFTCLDWLVQSSRGGRNPQGEEGKNKSDTGPMMGGQGRVRAKRRERNLSETREERHTALPSACVTGLPAQRGWKQPSPELFHPAHVSLSYLKQNCFHPGSPYTRNVRSGNYPLPGPSARQGSALTVGQSQLFLKARVCLRATLPGAVSKPLNQTNPHLFLAPRHFLHGAGGGGGERDRPWQQQLPADTPCCPCFGAGVREHSCSSWSCHRWTGPRGKEVAQVFGRLELNLQKVLFLALRERCADLGCTSSLPTTSGLCSGNGAMDTLGQAPPCQTDRTPMLLHFSSSCFHWEHGGISAARQRGDASTWPDAWRAGAFLLP